MRTSGVAALLVMVSAGSAWGQQPVRQGAAAAPRPTVRPAPATAAARAGTETCTSAALPSVSRGALHIDIVIAI